jgi:hypothetical protein
MLVEQNTENIEQAALFLVKFAGKTTQKCEFKA